MNSPLHAYLQECQARVERALDRRLPPAQTLPSQLHQAMRYAALNGGKRVRPVLVFAAGTALGVAPEQLEAQACAVELIHAYSLIHDDLPAMDAAPLRRGRPSCHRAFDEATALLAGDALQSLAFYVLAHDASIPVDAAQRLKMVEILALASGSRGMAGGQAIDLASTGKELNIAELEDMHIHKTGALIRASVRLGTLSKPGCDEALAHRLDHYAKCIGLAFQIRDDILDVEGDTATLGKPQGADLARDKPTYPALLGVEEAHKMAHELHQQALDSLSSLDKRADPLRRLAEYIVDRSR